MFEFLITTSKGMDALLLEEVAQICPDVALKNKPGQVLFSGSLTDAYNVCLWSRLANRVLVKLAEGEVNCADDVYHITDQVNWPTQFAMHNTFMVDFTGTNQSINNTQFGGLKVKDAIVDQFTTFFDQRPSVNKLSPDIRVQARMWRSILGIYIDLSGQSLHQRHYRLKTGLAPVKEHLASAMLIRSGWSKNQQAPLIDPMCGAGTIAIEAAMMASKIAPGLKRDKWGFDSWKQHDSELWQQLSAHAESQKVTPQCFIKANDIDGAVLKVAKENAQVAGVADLIEFTQQNACELSLENLVKGYLVSNPPYGERLSDTKQLVPLFQKWGVQLKQHFQDWHVSLLTSDRNLLREMKLTSKKEYKLMNGKLECLLVNFELDEKNCLIREIKPLENDFINRFLKNVQKTNKWLKKQNTNCYRIYDADLPEYNVAIDQYADHLVVQEYSAPKDVPEHKAKKRINEIMQSLVQVSGIESDKIVLKVREQQKGKNQYQKVAQRKERIEVFENGAKFQVNLFDYLDTGLFLDHRITRQLIQQKAKNKDVLNLFAYTGTVSVHAALGGAKSVTTVDMSNTYIDWAKDNFTTNNLRGAYEFIQADCLTWLKRHRGKYDLIFIDPPSFSNSKRMEATWDVQRDHVALITDALECLNPQGEIVFSNNLRQFKINSTELEALGLSIKDISNQTLPEDFKRNPKIHNCWSLIKR
ncbi:bifunctional 23S rRNA (guanine(2069)-N(7))-methyltransferase RlmK/23S rRNA (guanine(2445)-N(2))-methyltransferase RlmL [Paraglaciecola aquimarina]|uniref:Ribosomal RNA large subunit methyltransferase K/L n=1 Tax=Paraglaciecola algarum TaxID=3050085 RepID=A0ABS9D533_9ALTE|nr:bifunctional 23S rRNA (guanine(2069)-N(7))-methyltransferase RlmK/23S rRNA (guanine(2445)-N(2))-methyltransferase RlmL [Paraglaciecola sp. G1-23]MCF2947138.1 bifunctional 23S rRNA (guanine(2069)-N(7))-methyltransferase RlmK/23S rRNA (guanine(2445)-N(2))-methyltransferase RlmL [Paraglaciecola sp. G1-23]